MRYQHCILGSRSPRRLELLQQLVPRERILVRPPRRAEEAGFGGLADPQAIAARLLEIVDAKRRDVDEQLTDIERAASVGLVADTIILASKLEGRPIVLEQPPDADWQPTVQEWFDRYYSGRTHAAWTGVCLWNCAGILAWEIVATDVTFRPITPKEIDWYLSTGESRGKAGGYALQGLASQFVTRIEGSLTNVVGLPLEVVRRVLAE